MSLRSQVQEYIATQPCFASSGLTHRESYLDMVMTVIVSCIIALVAILVLGSVFGSF